MSSTMRAVSHQGDGINVKVEQKPIPEPKSGEILVKVRAIGQSACRPADVRRSSDATADPTDYKHAQLFSKKGARMGCDMAGEVAKLGPDVPAGALKEGDRVSGFVRGGMSETTGVFAEYATLPYDNVWQLPGNITFEEAATTPIPLSTAVQGLYLRLRLPEKLTEGEKPWLLVWSASSAVGQYVVQLARLTGLRVVATASKARWEHIKSLGADEVIDYKVRTVFSTMVSDADLRLQDEDAVEQIRKITGGKLQYAFDCVSNDTSTAACQRAIRDAGGKVVVVLFPDADKMPRKDVEVRTVWPAYGLLDSGAYRSFTRLPTRALHRDIQCAEADLVCSYLQSSGVCNFGPAKFEASAEEHQHYVKWLGRYTELFKSGQIKVHRAPLSRDLQSERARSLFRPRTLAVSKTSLRASPSWTPGETQASRWSTLYSERCTARKDRRRQQHTRPLHFFLSHIDRCPASSVGIHSQAIEHSANVGHRSAAPGARPSSASAAPSARWPRQ
jgi:NADPH:quinone reductase-like Zn-dependent oxidoreductase